VTYRCEGCYWNEICQPFEKLADLCDYDDDFYLYNDFLEDDEEYGDVWYEMSYRRYVDDVLCVK